MTNEELAIRIQRAGKEEKQDLLSILYEQNKGLIRKIAARYSFADDMEDLRQQGYIGLQTAAEGFDPEAGAMFATYAAICIKAEICRYLTGKGNAVRLPDGLYWKLIRLRKLRSDFQKEYGREPTDEEVEFLLDLSPVQHERIRKAEAMLLIGSTDAAVAGTDDLTVLDKVPDPEDRLQAVEDDILRRQFWSLIDTLPEEEGEAVKLCYRDSLEMKEAADVLQLPPNEVRKRLDKAFRKMRSGKLRSRLESFLEEKADSYGYGMSGLRAFRRTGSSSVELAIMAAENYSGLFKEASEGK